MGNSDRRYYTPDEIAGILGLGRTLTYKLLKSGRIPSVRMGLRLTKGGRPRYVVPVTTFDDWLKAEGQSAIDRARAASQPEGTAA